MNGDEPVRLQKALARAGVASRRAAEELIRAGRVTVGGETVTRMGTRVDTRVDVIRVDGRRLPPESADSYLVLNKPRGVVSTMADPQGRRCLADLVADRRQGLFHVGRLDTDTEGVLLLTNDGEFAHRMTHPSFEITKTYVAQVRGRARPRLVRELLAGVDLDDGPVTADRCVIVESHQTRSIVELDLHVGRNRVVRRMLAAAGHPVQRLTRTAFGPVRIDRLPPGGTRTLTGEELGELLDSVAL